VRRPSNTELLAVAAVGLTGTVIASEYWSVWRRGRAPLPAETDDVLGAGAEAARETVEVAVAGYRASPTRENAALNLLISYAVTAGVVRLSTYSIRTRGTFGPFRNAQVSGRHIHHYIPGIALAFAAGGVSVVSRDESLDRWCAIPLGIGAALTMDEAALLVELEDVYWSEEGILSVQATLGTLALLGATMLGARAFRRGEPEVLGGGDAPDLARAA
jgi:hypothetical protein